MNVLAHLLVHNVMKARAFVHVMAGLARIAMQLCLAGFFEDVVIVEQGVGLYQPLSITHLSDV